MRRCEGAFDTNVHLTIHLTELFNCYARERTIDEEIET